MTTSIVMVSALLEVSSWEGYWRGFLRFWGKFLSQQDGVVVTALTVMAVSIFIITRGRWRK